MLLPCPLRVLCFPTRINEVQIKHLLLVFLIIRNGIYGIHYSSSPFVGDVKKKPSDGLYKCLPKVVTVSSDHLHFST